MTNEHDITSTYEITGFEMGDRTGDSSFDQTIDRSFERLIDRYSEPPPGAPIDAALRAYAMEYPSFSTIPPERLRPMTLTIDVLHLAIQRAAPRILRYRELIEAELPNTDLRAIDGLDRRNTAMEVAQRNYERAMAPAPTSLPIDEASETPGLMLVELDALADASRLRQQAFTWTLMAYDVARRAIHYVRFDHGDADEIAPALCPARTRRSADEAFFFDLDPIELEPGELAARHVSGFAPAPTPEAPTDEPPVLHP